MSSNFNMNSAKSILFLTLLNLFSCQWVHCKLNSVTDSIIATAMLFRHGDRAPVGTYPTDPYADYKWPMGYGQLTPKGVRELYKSGMVKAARYESLIKGQHKSNCFLGPQNVYTVSSSSERCIMSAESFLDGLLPNLYRQININVPNPAEDTYLVFPGKDCKAYEAELEESIRLDRDDILQLTENGELVQYISNHTGMPINDLMSLLLTIDTLSVQRDNGLILPPWAGGIYYTYLEPLIKLTFEILCQTNKSQIRSGVLLNDVIHRFNNFLGDGNDTEVQNVLLYSAHDINVNAMLFLLDIEDQINERPAYASTIAWELHYRGHGKNDVEIVILYYRNAADENPIRVKIPDCPAPCSYNKFKNLMKSKLVSNYDEVCHN